MLRKSFSLVPAVAVLAGVVANANCSSHPSAAAGGSSPTSSAGSGGSAGGPSQFQADAPAVYVAKVKNILVGLPPTDAEVQQVVADPTTLPKLIDTWMALPQYDQKMQRFFQLAFQQTQITAADFVNTIPENGIGVGPGIADLMLNVQESFARTVVAMIDAGTPLNQAMTTKTLMMTPALMELYAFLDTYHVDDNGVATDAFAKAYPNAIISQETAQGPIPITETVDPTSKNFMTWYDPDVATLNYTTDPTCNGIDPITYKVSAYDVHWLLYGAVYNHKGPNGNCGSRAGTAASVQLAATDFTTWKLVTLRPPNAGETTTAFYDLPTLRTATELVINTPRPGFFSTPAFQANWPTNTSNQNRVTINQALIVATGMFVDGTDKTVPTSTPGLDAAHTSTSGACFECHKTLDPTRSILSATYSYFYFYPQTDPTLTSQPGLFAFQGVQSPVSTIDDLARILSTHPLFPSAWAQKLCYYANSQACLTTDPEFQRVVSVFQASSFNWNTLVKTLLSSPLTTNATPTQTTDASEVVAVSRRDHLCAALNNRLGLVDVCGIENTATKLTVLEQLAGGLPSDGYGRGSATPVLPNQPTLFYRSGVENICEAVANMVIDPTGNTLPSGARTWVSTGSSQTANIADFVGTIMAITPSDSRSAPAQAALAAHFASAVQMGNSASVALKSTFVTACLAPSAVGIGM